jgi:thiamine biosynthesis lipoprotein
MSRLRIALLGLVPLALPSAQAPEGASSCVERRLALMGTWLDLAVRARDRGSALAASEAALAALEASEARLSTWRDDSELARANRSPVGEPFALSDELAHELAEVRRYHAWTGGAFDPGIGTLIEAWGVRTGGRQPSHDELAVARADAGLDAIRIEGQSLVRLCPRVRLEEGAFGKGAGLDAAAGALRTAGVEAALLDLGGQVLVLGAPRTLELADPFERGRPVLALELSFGSLATSGNSERGLTVDGMRRAHILDPSTGVPVEDFGSLSVWAPTGLAADCLSTGLYVLGPEAAFRWHRDAARPAEPVEIVVLTRRAEKLLARASSGLRGRLRPLVSDLELEFEPASLPARSPNPQSPQ